MVDSSDKNVKTLVDNWHVSLLLSTFAFFNEIGHLQKRKDKIRKEKIREEKERKCCNPPIDLKLVTADGHHVRESGKRFGKESLPCRLRLTKLLFISFARAY